MLSHGQLGREDVVGHEEREGEEGRGEEKRYLLQTKKIEGRLASGLGWTQFHK